MEYNIKWKPEENGDHRRNREINEILADTMEELFPLEAGATILEIGGGNGAFAEVAAGRGYVPTVLDCDEDQLKSLPSSVATISADWASIEESDPQLAEKYHVVVSNFNTAVQSVDELRKMNHTAAEWCIVNRLLMYKEPMIDRMAKALDLPVKPVYPKLKQDYIQFNTNGGTSVASQKVYYQSKVTEPESPTKEGYTFTGWFTENECINKYDFNTLVTKSVTLYAGWKINEYTVTFVEAGGSDVENQTVKYGDKAISPNSTRTGYDFSGWYSDSSIKNLYDFDMPITSDIKLYAGWKIKQYVVSFNTNGGSKIPAQTVNYGEKVTEPNSPFIEGANFVGWYLDQDYKTKFDFNNKIKGNHTLYAKWDAVMCKVSFETNGGNNVESQNIIYGKKAIKPDNPIRDGYMFLGWYTDKELTKSYNFNSVVKNGMTLYASWKEIIANVDVSYKTHVQTFGWQDFVMNGSLSGTTGKAKRLEGIKIMVQGNDNLGIQYTTHCQTYGWLPWSANGELNGTEGEAKRLEAIKIQLTGTQAEKYDVYYRVHAQSYGWLNWAKNGEASGTAGYAKRLEGIQIVVVEKGSQAPGNSYLGVSSEYDIPYIFRTGNRNPLVAGDDETNVVYRCNVQSIGWQGWKYNGDKGGTSGQALRLEGLEIRLTNKQYQGGIRYRAQVQSKGWQTYVSNGATSGIVGKNKRLEAFQAELTGELAEHYDLYYRTHVQNYGWMEWVSNGRLSGTTGKAKRIEAYKVKLEDKV